MLGYGCDDMVIFPSKGSIRGTITDNNGTPLSGVTVSITYNQPAQSPGEPVFPQTKTVQTDDNGYYMARDLWDEIQLTVQGTGYEVKTLFHDLKDDNEPEINLVLSGSPTVLSYAISKPILRLDTIDAVVFDVEVRDAYNESVAPIQCNVRLLDDNLTTIAVYSADLKSQGLEHYLFTGQILSENFLDTGTFFLEVEVLDPDLHTHRLSTGLTLTVE